MLAVVQNQQCGSSPQIVRECLGNGSPRLLAHLERRGHDLRQEGGLGERYEIDPPEALLKRQRQFPGHRQRQPRLAAARWTSEREQETGSGSQQLFDLKYLALSA